MCGSSGSKPKPPVFYTHFPESLVGLTTFRVEEEKDSGTRHGPYTLEKQEQANEVARSPGRSDDPADVPKEDIMKSHVEPGSAKEPDMDAYMDQVSALWDRYYD
jgi:hypothetical protein